jgi:2-methylisocitrate lyase-like PEP mutase family enzyme
VAAIHIEDQVLPKKCGHLDDKEIVPRDDYIAKIRAAVAARRNADFMIIARTDARAVAGLDEAITRANAALAVGADMAFVEAPQTMEELAAVPKRVAGPCLLNVVRGGKTPEVNLLDAEKMGYRMAIVPGLLMKSFIGIGDAMLAELKRTHVHPTPSGDPTVRQVFNRFGANEWDELRTRFRDDAAKIKAAE